MNEGSMTRTPKQINVTGRGRYTTLPNFQEFESSISTMKCAESPTFLDFWLCRISESNNLDYNNRFRQYFPSTDGRFPRPGTGVFFSQGTMTSQFAINIPFGGTST